MQIDRVKLLSCPFCGNEPELRDDDDEDFMHEIICVHCDITMMASAVSKPLIEAWNTRPQEDVQRVRASKAINSLRLIEKSAQTIMPIHTDMQQLLNTIISCNDARWTRLYAIYAEAKRPF